MGPSSREDGITKECPLSREDQCISGVQNVRYVLCARFAEMIADADAGHGSDSIQTFLGIALDPLNLFKKPGTADCQ